MKKLYVLLFACFWTTFSFAQTANTQDSLALVAIYNSTNGASWKNNSNWLSGSVSNWYGITIDANGRVTKINLESNNLTGSIPSEIGNLSNLTDLFLYYNPLALR